MEKVTLHLASLIKRASDMDHLENYVFLKLKIVPNFE